MVNWQFQKSESEWPSIFEVLGQRPWCAKKKLDCSVATIRSLFYSNKPSAEPAPLFMVMLKAGE